MKKLFLILVFCLLWSGSVYAKEENAFYAEYLKKCSKDDVNFYNLKDQVYIFESSTISLSCITKEFENHLNNFPVGNVVPRAIIRNWRLITDDIEYKNITISSLYSQKCGEECELSDEAIIIYNDKYWYIRGMNDRGIQGFLLNNEILHIQNYNSTHTKNYIFNIKDKKFMTLPNGGLEFNKDYILVKGQKSYFEPMGAFWFNSKINYSSEIIELISDGNTCEPLNAFRENIQLAMKKMGLKEFCVTTY